LFRLSWKRRRRSTVKITERTHEKGTTTSSPEQKVTILRRHLLDKVPISDLCEEFGLQPTIFYRWQKEFFESGGAAFQQNGRPNYQAEQQRVSYPQKKIQTYCSLGSA